MTTDICADFNYPAEYYELETDSMEYIYGESQKHIGNYAYNDDAGLKYLSTEAGITWDFSFGIMGTTTAAAGGIMKIVGGATIALGLGPAALAVIGAAGAILAAVGLIGGWYRTSAWDAYMYARYDFAEKGKNYSVWRDQILFVDTGYVVKGW